MDLIPFYLVLLVLVLLNIRVGIKAPTADKFKNRTAGVVSIIAGILPCRFIGLMVSDAFNSSYRFIYRVTCSGIPLFLIAMVLYGSKRASRVKRVMIPTILDLDRPTAVGCN